MVATLGIFVVTASGDYSLVAIGGLLIVVAPLVAEHGLKGMRAAVVAPRRVGSSRLGLNPSPALPGRLLSVQFSHSVVSDSL